METETRCTLKMWYSSKDNSLLTAYIPDMECKTSNSQFYASIFYYWRFKVDRGEEKIALNILRPYPVKNKIACLPD